MKMIKRMKSVFQIFTLSYLLLCVGVTYAENKVETGNIEKSEVQIYQDEQPSDEKKNTSNKVKTGNIEGSTIQIEQGSNHKQKISESSPWWEHFFKEIIAGIIGLIFALLLWRIKSRWGTSGNQ